MNHPPNIYCRLVTEMASLCFTSGKLRKASQLLLQLIFTHFVCASGKTNLIILLKTLNSDILKTARNLTIISTQSFRISNFNVRDTSQ